MSLRAAAVQPHNRVFQAHVVDPVRKGADELYRIDILPEEVAAVEVEPEFRPAVERVERPLRRDEIERYFRGVHFLRALFAALTEHVEDRIPALDQQPEAEGSVPVQSVV